ncbi:Gfo/Idh/MocA family oxidoreductase [SAR202 cluster bacterium AD-802-E10_MRT_200m]|jgi:predicted dehydrogenase|nr:Gfo/Idh/MocA family oxidoreductase [SAR202 cluster bacterium AD-802-E10_MRT_200m]
MGTMAQPLRVGLIGAMGRWGPSAHIPAIQNLPETELYAVCTAHADTAQSAAQKYNVELAYSDDKVMNENQDIEAIAVSVRVPVHYALTKNALEAGKHVYCEWPLGADLKEAEDLAELARKVGAHTMVGLQRRASPVYLRMQELVNEGYVGQILGVNLVQMGSGVLTRTADRTWQRDVTLGANTLTIAFGHAIDAMAMVAGNITEVSGQVSTQVSQWYESDTQKYVDVTSPDNIMISGKLENGAVVSAYVGVHPYHGSGNRMEIYGKEGTLALVTGSNGALQIMGGQQDDQYLAEIPIPERLTWVPPTVQNSGPGFEVGQMWANFANSIRTNSFGGPDFDHAVQCHKLLEAVQRASDTGQRQKIQ